MAPVLMISPLVCIIRYSVMLGSEFRLNLGSVGHLTNLADFGESTAAARFMDTGVNLCQAHRALFRLKPKNRNRTVSRHTKARKVRRKPFRLHSLRTSESELRSVLSPRNCGL